MYIMFCLTYVTLSMQRLRHVLSSMCSICCWACVAFGSKLANGLCTLLQFPYAAHAEHAFTCPVFSPSFSPKTLLWVPANHITVVKHALTLC